MDSGGFIVLGLAALAFVIYAPWVLLYSLRRGERRGRHWLRLAGLGLFVLLGGLFIRQEFVLNEPLPHAAGTGDVREVRRLLAAGASPNAQGVDGRTTALTQAAAAGEEEVVRLLLAAGADANLPDDTGRTPLQHARKARNPEVVRLLIQAGAR